jgi:hypothetical protein
VLVSVTDSNLASSAQSSGNDILFTASDGVTKLNHEIETYTSSTGLLNAWVSVPSLSPTTDTIIYMYYGNGSASNQQNSSAVWSGNYAAVYHLDQNPNGSAPQLIDSTANTLTLTTMAGPDGTGGVASMSSITGVVAGAVNFATTNQYYFDYASSTSNSAVSSASVTVEGWVNINSFLTYDGGALNNLFGLATTSYPVNAAEIGLNLTGSAPKFFASFGTNGNAGGLSSTTVSAGTWYYVVATWNGSTVNLYVNGVLSNSSALSDGMGSARFNMTVDNQRGSNAKYDELRVLNTVLTPSWIATEYNNQSSPSTFFSVGGQQTSGG